MRHAFTRITTLLPQIRQIMQQQKELELPLLGEGILKAFPELHELRHRLLGRTALNCLRLQVQRPVQVLLNEAVDFLARLQAEKEALRQLRFQQQLQNVLPAENDNQI